MGPDPIPKRAAGYATTPGEVYTIVNSQNHRPQLRLIILLLLGLLFMYFLQLQQELNVLIPSL